MRYCVDAGFVLARAGLSSNPAALQRWRSFRATDELISPTILWAECTSVLMRATFQGPLSAQLVRRLVEALPGIPVALVHNPEHYLRAFDILNSPNRTKPYDALYLAVAEIEGAELLTIDRAVYSAAARLSIPATLIA
jgi:predicted nucleic acid-binding protein